MAGLRSLHIHDPETYTKQALSERFGISYEAVSRILRSKFQDRQAAGRGGLAGEMESGLEGTKWDLDARTSALSPVPALNRAFAARASVKTALEEQGAEDHTQA